MRKGEILSLTWNNVDFDKNLFIINVFNNKSKKVKRIPINSYLKTMLLELKLLNHPASEYVFPGDNDKPIRDVKTASKDACRGANMQGLWLHELRHTAATRMLEGVVNVVAISEIRRSIKYCMDKKEILTC